MIRRLILALGLLLCSIPAFAGPKPPDVLAYVPQTVTYATGTTQNVLGDGSNARGGTAPALAYQLANIATSSPSSWIDAGTYNDSGDQFCLVPDGIDHTHTCPEPKMRTHLGTGQVLFDDPERNFGQPGTAHCHAFFGSFGTNAYSTYLTLRNGAHSTASGGDLNKTGYWVPCLVLTNPFSDGKNYAIKPNVHVFYYNGESATNALRLQPIPRGFRDVTGVNMDDPDDTIPKREIYLANLGAPGRYSYWYNGVLGWQCDNGGGGFAPALKNTNGTDGFTGIEAGNTCVAGQMAMVLNARQCWDGVNLWSTDGYSHTRYEINDNLAPDSHTCPNGWYLIPTRQEQVLYTFAGAADYMRARLASDDPMAAKLNSLPTCTAGYANAPCNDGGGVRTVGNGGSVHMDWDDGADDTNFRTVFETNGLGLFGGTQHLMQPGVISGTQATKYLGRPDNYIVDVSPTYGTATAGAMILIGTTHNGQPTTIHSNTVNSH